MSKNPVPLVKPAVAGAILCTALAVFAGLFLFSATFASPPTAHATSLAQVATPTPAPVVLSTAVTGTASYDPADDLTTASVNLHAGFIMDPYLLPIVGKGEKAASEVVKGCNGYLGAEPSVILNWMGKTDQLNLFVYSDGDAVLAVQKPDGSFICNDDAGARTVDPLLTIKNPAAGAYKVYAGGAESTQPALGFLAVTQAELDAAKLAALDLSPMLRRRERPALQPIEQLDPKTLLLNRPAIFGSADLESGFKPVQVFAAGGGNIGAVRVEDGNVACAGYITAVPSYSFTYNGDPHAIRLYFEGLKDASLAVVTPDEKVLCGMNATPDNLNPIVDIAAAAKGPYRVYVAAMQPNTVVAGKLTITGEKAVPAVLPPAAQ